MIYDWYTDIHADHCTKQVLDDLLGTMSSSDADGFFLTGDLSTSGPCHVKGFTGQTKLQYYLQLLEKAAKRRPVYFVLGNHDFYGSCPADVHDQLDDMVCYNDEDRIYSLTLEDMYYPTLATQPFRMGDRTYLVGHDGWYDGSPAKFGMADFVLNGDLKGLFPEQRAERCRAWSDAAANHVLARADRALELGADRIIVLTHVPPFKECHYHQGVRGAASFNPWFVSERMGYTLRTLATGAPYCKFEVLCGHTHGPYDGVPFAGLPNLHVKVGRSGEADYGRPAIAGRIEI